MSNAPRDTANGPIGADWALVELGTVAEPPQYGLTASASSRGDAQFLRITDIVGRNVDWTSVPFCECSPAALSRHLLRSGDILFARIGATTGKSTLVVDPPKAVFASYLIRIRPKPDLDPEFLSHFFQSDGYWRQIDSNKNANLKKGVSGSALKSLLVPKPPLKEQRQIAAVLSAVQRAIERQKRLIALTAELKKALMHKLFTEGTRGEPLKQTEIGMVPRGWDVVNLGSCCILATGTTPSTTNPDLYIGKNALIKTDQIANARITEANLFVSDDALERYGLKIFPPRTVLMAMYGQGKTRGQVGILDISASITQNAAAIVAGESLTPDFIYFYLMSQYARLRQSGFDGQISHLNLGFLRRLLIPLPPWTEQKQIADVLTHVEAKEQRHRTMSQLLNQLFKSLLHQLMTAQIRIHDLDLSKLEPQQAPQKSVGVA